MMMMMTTDNHCSFSEIVVLFFLSLFLLLLQCLRDVDDQISDRKLVCFLLDNFWKTSISKCFPIVSYPPEGDRKHVKEKMGPHHLNPGWRGQEQEGSPEISPKTYNN